MLIEGCDTIREVRGERDGSKTAPPFSAAASVRADLCCRNFGGGRRIIEQGEIL